MNQLLDSVVNVARFLTGGAFKCDIAHRRSAAVLCMMRKIRCNPAHSLYDALPVPCAQRVAVKLAVEAAKKNGGPRWGE